MKLFFDKKTKKWSEHKVFKDKFGPDFDFGGV